MAKPYCYQRARENNLKNINVTIPRTSWWCSPACPGQGSPPWRLRRCMLRASGGMWSPFLLCPDVFGADGEAGRGLY